MKELLLSKLFEILNKEFWSYRIQQNGLLIRYIRNPPYNLLVDAVIQNGLSLKYIKEQDHNLCHLAIKQNWQSIKYVKNQTYDLCHQAIKINIKAIKLIKNYYEDLAIYVLSKNGYYIKYIKNKTSKLCDIAVKNNYLAIKFIKNPEQYKDLILKYPLALKYLNLSYEDKLKAVSQNGICLKYIDDQTHELCMTAVKKNGMALRYVKNKTEDICMKAMKKCAFAFKFVENISEKMIYEIVKYNYRILEYIDKKYHTEELCLNAIQDYPNAIFSFKGELTDKIIFDVLKKNGQYICLLNIHRIDYYKLAYLSSYKPFKDRFFDLNNYMNINIIFDAIIKIQNNLDEKKRRINYLIKKMELLNNVINYNPLNDNSIQFIKKEFIEKINLFVK